MKILSRTAIYVGLIVLAAGCVTERRVGYWPPPRPDLPPSRRPLPPPPVVVVHRPHYPAPRPPEPWVDVSITVEERRVIREYGQDCLRRPGPGKKKGWKHGGLPPGLAKKVEHGGRLPPGWQAKLAKGAVMPVEVYQECHSLPREVIAKLPPPPRGTILIAVDGKIVRLLQATREILDVFEVDL